MFNNIISRIKTSVTSCVHLPSNAILRLCLQFESSYLLVYENNHQLCLVLHGEITNTKVMRVGGITFCYTAIPYRASTGPEQGFPCVVNSHREKPVFITGNPSILIAGILYSLQGFP